MADRYWVGGTANWDGTAGTKWATTSGGAGGASVPGSADDVFFSNLSTGTCTIATGNSGARSINCTGFTGTLAGTAAISVAGSITLAAGMTFNYTGVVTLTATGTLTSAGKTLGNITINTAGITVTLGSALTSSGTITLSAGTFNTSASNFSVNAASFHATTAGTKVITLNGSTVTVTSSVFPWWMVGTNITINAGTSTINLNGTASQEFVGGNKTYNNVAFTSTTSSGAITGANTFNNLTFATPTVPLIYAYFDPTGTNTITGTLTLNAGTTGVKRRRVSNNLPGAATISVATLAPMADVDFDEITVIGAAAPLTGTRIGNLGGNSGITFTAARTVYWVLPAGGNWDAAAWSTTSGNTGGTTTAFPLAQDSIVIDNAGLTAGNTITYVEGFAIPNISFATRSTAATFDCGSAFEIQCYGNFILSSSVTLTASSSELTFLKQSGTSTLTTAGVTIPSTLNLLVDVGVGTLQLGSTLVTSSGISTFTGTLALNGFNITANYVQSIAGTSPSISFGTNSITTTGTGTGSASPWNFPELTGAIFTGTPQVNFAGDGEIRHGTSSGGSESTAVSFTRTGPGTGAVNFGASHIKNLVFSSTATWTIAGATKTIYGNLTLAASTTLGAGAANAVVTFAGTGTQLITMAGKTYDGPMNFSGVGGTYIFQDALTLGSTRALTFSNGTLRLKDGATSTVGSFVTTGTTLKFLQSTAFGTQATISDASGTNTVTYLSLQDSNATGGATFIATSTTNVNAGNNTGWSIVAPQSGASMFFMFN
jgi:hypothetical protein